MQFLGNARHAGAGRVERELADRDAHAVCAEIAESEDSSTVSHDDDTDARSRPIPQ